MVVGIVRIIGIGALVLLLAGCCSPQVEPSQVPRHAPAEGHAGPREITIALLGPDNPVDDVAVFVFWQDPADSARLVLMGLRSQQGRVLAHVPANADIGIAAGGGPWTSEYALDVASAGGPAVNHVMRVYPRHLTAQFNDSWAPAAVSVWGSSHLGPVAYHLRDVRPGNSNVTREGYADRLVAVRANLTWTNTQDAQADLGIGAWSNRGSMDRCTFHNEHDESEVLGPASEGYDSDKQIAGAEAPCGIGGLVDVAVAAPHTILLGPATDKPAIMPNGIPYAINYTLTFGYPDGLDDLCAKAGKHSYLVYLDPRTGKVDHVADYTGHGSPSTPLGVAVAALAAAAYAVRRQKSPSLT